jgi:hypothetical protein
MYGEGERIRGIGRTSGPVECRIRCFQVSHGELIPIVAAPKFSL